MKPLATLLFSALMLLGDTAPCQHQTSMPYTNGYVMNNSQTIYPIFYGNNITAYRKSLILDFLSHLGASSYWGIPAGYCDSYNNMVTSSMSVASEVDIAGYSSYGGTWSTAGPPQQMIQDLINSSTIPASANAMYVIIAQGMGSPTISYHQSYSSGYPTQGAWYNSGVAQLKYTVIFIPSSLSSYPSPNGDMIGDSACYVLAHELAEMATDPLYPVGGWYDSSFSEIADVCTSYSSTFTAPNGNLATVQMASSLADSNNQYGNYYSYYRDYFLPALFRNTTASNCGYTNY